MRSALLVEGLDGDEARLRSHAQEMLLGILGVVEGEARDVASMPIVVGGNDPLTPLRGDDVVDRVVFREVPRTAVQAGQEIGMGPDPAVEDGHDDVLAADPLGVEVVEP